MLEKLKEKAIERLEWLTKEKGLADWVLRDFKKDGSIYWCERTPLGGILYWANEAGGCPQEVMDKIKELTNDKSICYMVTHEYTSFGELYDYWIISEEDLEYGDKQFKENNLQFVLSQNVDMEYCSDYGDIQFAIAAGGPIRVG